MRVKTTPPTIDVVKREEKEGRVTGFILEHLQAAPADNTECRLIARSISSPVFRALAAIAASGQLHRPVKIILASTDGCEAGGPTDAARFASAIRIARNPRLLDAHEQLVLGPNTAWIGDCMRREPEKRDAWECYADTCSETALRAGVSFERLWAMCEPTGGARGASATSQMPEFVMAGADVGTPTRPLTSTA
jgi:hypothetical protein